MNYPHQQKSTRKKKLALAVTNDLISDNRVHKVATTLLSMGYDVQLIGRILPSSPSIERRSYTTHRFSLWFNKGPLFYANYNIALFFYLLFNNFDVVVANDLDTLLACFVASKITKKKLVYDSHEYFTEVPELVDRPKVKAMWERIERHIVPNLKHCYTVCQSIADIYNAQYGTTFKVVQNVPSRLPEHDIDRNFLPPFPIDQPVILYQGAVNLGRGIEEAILAMHQLENVRLVIIGDGDKLTECKNIVENEGLSNNVILTGRKTIHELKQITHFATIGLSVEKDMGLNYRYALPNKLFDYIQSEVPVLASELPEIKRIVDLYKIGLTIPETTPESIAVSIKRMLNSPELMAEWKKNCAKAKEDLCWENEEKVLIALYQQL
jgi:glycosyltransferase involved in cell wall biosynthesis